MLGNINPEDFNPETDMVAYDDLTKTDQYIMVRLNDVVAEYRKDVMAYDYLSANKVLMNFMVNELSSYYCDFTKDILYCDEPEGLRRRQVQSVYWQCTDALVKMWAPFLCYTAEEIWTHFGSKEEPSVHYTNFPEVKEYANAEELKKDFEQLLKVRDAVNKSIENARNDKLVASAQEACVTIACSAEEKALLEGTLTNVPQWFIVSKALITEGEGEPVITRAAGTKCPRCWNYSETPDENDLCPRCHDVMAKMITR
jgi:isoleucyl-tRNA synthetase